MISIYLLLDCIISASSLSSCSDTHDTAKTKDQIISEYEHFSDSVYSLSSIPYRHLPDLVYRWITLGDEMLSIISNDSVDSDESLIDYSRISVFDSRISTKLHTAVDDRLHTFQEAFAFERNLANSQVFSKTPFLNEANEFYRINLCQSAEIDSPSEQRDQYLSFLEEAIHYEISDFDDIKEILFQEDLLYRAYLKNMMAHSFTDSYRIVSATEELAGALSSYASSHPSDAERMVAYMSVRTVCRQIKCAQQGIAGTSVSD